MPEKIDIVEKLNNIIFVCYMENKFYSTADRGMVWVTNLVQYEKDSASGNMQVQFQRVPICEVCFKDPKNKFKNPSKIITDVPLNFGKNGLRK